MYLSAFPLSIIHQSVLRPKIARLKGLPVFSSVYAKKPIEKRLYLF